MLTLDLKNYRRFANSGSISFLPGLTIVTGPNGAGKTTLAEAIAYGLFGPKRGPGGGGVRSDNSLGDIEVRLALRIDGHEVVVHRKGQVARLWLDGTQQIADVPNSVSQVNRQLSLLLGGLTRSQFLHIYVAVQGDTAGLVASDSTPRVRRDTLEVALQLDVLSKAGELQELERARSVGTLETQAGITSILLRLSNEQRKPLDQFRAANSRATRLHCLSILLGTLADELTSFRERTAATTTNYEESERVAAVARQLRDQQGKDIARLKQELESHDQRYERYQIFVPQIAAQELLRTTNLQDAATKVEEIAAAESCVDAAERHALAATNLQEMRARLAALPQVKDRWHVLQNAIKDKSRIIGDMRKLGDPEADLELAITEVYVTKTRWDLLQVDPTKEALGELERRAGQLDSEEEQAKTALAALESDTGDSRCPACGQALQGHVLERRLAHLTDWLTGELPRRRAVQETERLAIAENHLQWVSNKANAQQEWQGAAKKLTGVNTRLTKLGAFRTNLEHAVTTVSEARSTWAELGETGDWVPTEAEELSARCHLVEQDIVALDAATKQYESLPRLRVELEQLGAKVKGAVETVNRLCAEQAKIGYDATAHSNLKQLLQRSEEALSQIRDDVAAKEAEATRLKSLAKEAREALSLADSAIQELNTAAWSYRRDERLSGLLSSFYNYYFTANTHQVAERASELILQAATDGSILGVRFDGTDLYYLDGSNARQPIARLSGGEKALVGLCIRLALAEQALKVAPTGKLQFLILDEVLSALDDERREAMERVFDEVQRRGVFEHIIMITHLEGIKQGWQGARLAVEKVDAKRSRLLMMGGDEPEFDDAGPMSLIDPEICEAERDGAVNA